MQVLEFGFYCYSFIIDGVWVIDLANVYVIWDVVLIFNVFFLEGGWVDDYKV